MNPIRILIIDEDTEFAYSLKTLLEQNGQEAEIARTRAAAMDSLLYSPFDVLLLDLELSSGEGIEILRELNSAGSALPIITMTAHGSIEAAAEAMHLNAFDFITKPFASKEMLEIVQRAVDFSRTGNGRAHEDTTGRTVPVMGQSTVMIEIYKEIGRIASTDSSVLITGETGSGHEIVARAIHDHSSRAGRPFIAVRCSEKPEAQLDRELFQSGGAFQKASGGTLFLEDIQTLTPALQTQLWRLLQIRSVVPVDRIEHGASDVRLVAASSRFSDALLAAGFRKDLLSHFSASRIQLPALRERAADIPLLAAHFVRKHARRLKKSVILSADAAEALKALSWLGNLRELENAIEHAVVMNRSGEINQSDFPQLSTHPVDNLISVLQELRRLLPENSDAQRLCDQALSIALKK
jgi:DNA-binding NtrC family response regulator